MVEPVSGSRFKLLDVEDEMPMEMEEPETRPNLDPENRRDKRKIQCESEPGRVSTQEFELEHNLGEKSGQTAVIAEAVKEGAIIEEKSAVDRSTEINEERIVNWKKVDEIKEVIPIIKDTQIPRLQPKLPFKGDRMPLSSNSKLATLRGPKIRKGTVKKSTRPKSSGKENFEVYPTVSLAAASQKEALLPPTIHGFAQTSNNFGIQNSTPTGIFCRESDGRADPDSSPSNGKQGQIGDQCLSPPGECESILNDGSRDTICNRWANEGIEGVVSINDEQDTSA